VELAITGPNNTAPKF